MKNEIEYTRKGRVIKNEQTGETQEFKSINKAKEWSRTWQKANGGLGTGKLRVA